MGAILSTCPASPGEIQAKGVKESDVRVDETNDSLRRIIACLKEDNRRLQHEVSTIVTGEFTRSSLRTDRNADISTPVRLDQRPAFIAELLALNPDSPLVELWRKDLALSELQGVYVEDGEMIGL
ncbi:hypothetical protein BSKO_13863 [Bryopsis sp. KO-2023]|nr:hypothetical protein BSKO_13863 [Bryopsis sp. KO-2023]